jgi:hypothetical protein
MLAICISIATLKLKGILASTTWCPGPIENWEENVLSIAHFKKEPAINKKG